MQLQILFRGMEPSPALEYEIRERVTKLEQVHPRIVSCRVAVDAPGHKGSPFGVRIDLFVPGQEVAVAREPGRNQAHADVHVALRDAFDAARRQLESHRERTGV